MTKTVPDSFSALCSLCERLTEESGKKQLTQLVAAYLRSLDPHVSGIATLFLLGVPLPGGQKLNVGPSTLWSAVSEVAPAQPEDYEKVMRHAVDGGEAVHAVMEAYGPKRTRHFSIKQVWSYFKTIAAARGNGSATRRRNILVELLAGMNPVEAKWATKIVGGEMRHGVSEGLMIDAIAGLGEVERTQVETAFMFTGAIEQVAEGVLRQGAAYLAGVGPTIFIPVRPMLAEPCDTVEQALEAMSGACVFEYKLDGARVQIHKQGDEVMIFSRSLRSLTSNLPEIADICRSRVKADTAILDGEAIATSSDGEPLPFQKMSKRITAEPLPLGFAESTMVRLFLFDLLLVDGQPCFGLDFAERRKTLASVVEPGLLVPTLEQPTAEEAKRFFAEAVRWGHEGLVAKHPASRYRPGSRGKQWLKIKKKITLDLVIIGAEYGYGRRHGWLSNYLLATRDETTGRLVPVGKTFKGLTDTEFGEMTERLTAIKIAEERGVVTVKPEVVVEVSFGEIQKSRRYESGYALRFARIERIRDDKKPGEIDTLQHLIRIHTKGGSGRTGPDY
jgi:DNA ligase-1